MNQQRQRRQVPPHARPRPSQSGRSGAQTACLRRVRGRSGLAFAHARCRERDGTQRAKGRAREAPVHRGARRRQPAAGLRRPLLHARQGHGLERHRGLGGGLRRVRGAAGHAGRDRGRVRAPLRGHVALRHGADVSSGPFRRLLAAPRPHADGGVVRDRDRGARHRGPGARRAGPRASGRTGPRAAARLYIPLPHRRADGGGLLQLARAFGRGRGGVGGAGLHRREVRPGRALHHPRSAPPRALRPRSLGALLPPSARSGGRRLRGAGG